MQVIQSHEIELSGKWVLNDGHIVGDSTCDRINWLMDHLLIKITDDEESGWDTLYRDPHDERLWERTFPYSEMHVGGAPKLTFMTREQAFAKYRVTR